MAKLGERNDIEDVVGNVCDLIVRAKKAKRQRRIMGYRFLRLLKHLRGMLVGAGFGQSLFPATTGKGFDELWQSIIQYYYLPLFCMIAGFGAYLVTRSMTDVREKELTNCKKLNNEADHLWKELSHALALHEPISPLKTLYDSYSTKLDGYSEMPKTLGYKRAIKSLKQRFLKQYCSKWVTKASDHTLIEIATKEWLKISVSDRQKQQLQKKKNEINNTVSFPDLGKKFAQVGIKDLRERLVVDYLTNDLSSQVGPSVGKFPPTLIFTWVRKAVIEFLQ